MDVLRLFGAEEEDFTHVFLRYGDDFINTVTQGGRSVGYTFRQRAEGQLEYKRCAKRSAKLAFYEYLCERTGKSFNKA